MLPSERGNQWEPDKKVRHDFIRRIIALGVRPQEICLNLLNATLLAMAGWLRSEQGLAILEKIINFGELGDRLRADDHLPSLLNLIKRAGLKVRGAPIDMKYRVYENGKLISVATHDEVTLITGFVVKGHLIPEEVIEFEKYLPDERCHYCGNRQYCVRLGEDPYEGKQFICNYCAYSSREQGILPDAQFDECLECNVMRCHHNPLRRDNTENVRRIDDPHHIQIDTPYRIQIEGPGYFEQIEGSEYIAQIEGPDHTNLLR